MSIKKGQCKTQGLDGEEMRTEAKVMEYHIQKSLVEKNIRKDKIALEYF